MFEAIGSWVHMATWHCRLFYYQSVVFFTLFFHKSHLMKWCWWRFLLGLLRFFPKKSPWDGSGRSCGLWPAASFGKSPWICWQAETIRWIMGPDPTLGSCWFHQPGEKQTPISQKKIAPAAPIAVRMESHLACVDNSSPMKFNPSSPCLCVCIATPKKDRTGTSNPWKALKENFKQFFRIFALQLTMSVIPHPWLLVPHRGGPLRRCWARSSAEKWGHGEQRGEEWPTLGSGRTMHRMVRWDYLPPC